jgi:ABC-type multidrug transport system permease subunit
MLFNTKYKKFFEWIAKIIAIIVALSMVVLSFSILFR